MSIKGELGTFSVAEILQLIGSQEKTGILHLRSRGRIAVLFFDSGRIISARDRRLGAKNSFLSYLLENEAISVRELNRVIEIRNSEGRDILDIMLDQNVIDERRLGEMLSNHALETVANCVKWETGTYEFSASAVQIPDKQICTPMRLEPVLMDALRRKDEFEQRRRFLPGFENKLKISVSNIDELPLEDEETSVLRLVNGNRTIDEIIEEGDAEEVETLDILDKLFALGIISISEDAPAADEKGTLSSHRSLILAFAVVIASLGLRFGPLSTRFQENPGTRPIMDTVYEFVESREIEDLHLALEAYKAIAGTYPQRLEEIVSADLVQADQIRDRHGTIYAYRHFVSEDRYLLSP